MNSVSEFCRRMLIEMNEPKRIIPFVVLKELAQAMGYQFEQVETDTDIIERMIRPDGSVAVTAVRRRDEHKTSL